MVSVLLKRRKKAQYIANIAKKHVLHNEYTLEIFYTSSNHRLALYIILDVEEADARQIPFRLSN
jgi:chromosomal replication initiation ATPase DnaA